MSIFKSEKIEKSLGVVLDVLFALVLLFSLFMTVSTSRSAKTALRD